MVQHDPANVRPFVATSASLAFYRLSPSHLPFKHIGPHPQCQGSCYTVSLIIISPHCLYNTPVLHFFLSWSVSVVALPPCELQLLLPPSSATIHQQSHFMKHSRSIIVFPLSSTSEFAAAVFSHDLWTSITGDAHHIKPMQIFAYISSVATI